jgi:pSer/pThr/pTyr-binding forkhead associated (FHA) protein
MSAAPAAPAAPASSAISPPTSPTAPRPSALRGGFSFLRNYTLSLQSHAGPGTLPESGPSEHNSSGRPRALTQTTTTPPVSPSSASSSALARPQTLSRTHTAPPLTPLSPASDVPLPPATMTRTRAETAGATPQLLVRNMSGPTPLSPAVSNTSAQGDRTEGSLSTQRPSIRFICHQDPRAARPSLQFTTVQRTLPDESQIIRVGRYSERDNIPEVPANVPSAAAVGFKSKVVSRKHCELWCKDGNWFIKDVKSSSGTFLNHIRLSQPNIESKPFQIKDGDIIQLGIDFRGGEEMIFRCVKIRIECNRGWQQALNTFK